MTPQEAKELLPIIEAFANGETIQYNVGPKHAPSIWIDIGTASFVLTPDQYRIKPKPRLVEMNHEDLPPVFWVKRKNGADSCCLITGIDVHGRLLANGIPIILSEWRWSTDRKTWQDFTKEVAE